MRILILSQWFWPEPMKLLSDMAETLIELGHEVQVLTGYPNWPSGRLYPGYQIRLCQREQAGKVPVTRIPLYPDHSRSSLRRILNYTSFVAAAASLGPFVAQRPDLIHAIQPPTTCSAAWVLGRIWRVPFTLEVQDLWPETLTATGMIGNRQVVQLVGHYCAWAYRKAAAIRVISPGFKRNLVAKGVPEQKVFHIPNWVDCDYYRPQSASRELAVKYGLQERFNVVYAGTVGLAQGLDTVVRAAGLLRDLEKVQLVVIGDGLDLPRLMQLANEQKLTNVKFLGRLPMELMPQLYAVADGLLVHLKDDPLFRITIPHKTLTYLAAGKPIVAALEGDAADVVEMAQAGLVCRSGDPAALAATVRKLWSQPPGVRRALGHNGREYATSHFGRNALIAAMVEMFEFARSPAGRGSLDLVSSRSHP